MSFFKENKFHLFVIGSFIFNIVFKFIYIDHSAYSYDEMISVKDTLLDFGHIKHESEWDTNPPFYYYCIWCWQKIAGLSEFGIRSFSALFNALTLVILSYYLKKENGYLKKIKNAFLSRFSTTQLNKGGDNCAYSGEVATSKLN